MNSTLVTHLFNFRSKEKGNGIHITLMKLTDAWSKTLSKLIATRIPTSAAKPWSFLCQKCRSVCTMKCQTFPKYPTLKMFQKIQYIDHPNPFPCLQRLSSSFQELFQPILNKELKSRQSNNLPLYGRKLIHSFNFHFLVNESSRTSKYEPKLQHSHQITSRQINSYIKK